MGAPLLTIVLLAALGAGGAAPQSPATAFKGRPAMKVSEGGVERIAELLTRERASNLGCVISEIGGWSAS